jgi:hypothetical protein
LSNKYALVIFELCWQTVICNKQKSYFGIFRTGKKTPTFNRLVRTFVQSFLSIIFFRGNRKLLNSQAGHCLGSTSV